MIRRLAAVLVGTAALTLPATAAVAAPVTCYSGYACMNDGGMYGFRVFLDSPAGGYGCKVFASNVIDWGSNEASRNLQVFDNNSCSGVYSYLYAHTTGDLGSWDNRISSARFV